MQIPADVYWGIHTARALINFPISRRAISNYPDLVRALARVKQASARANAEIGVLDAKKADIIDAVCQRIVDGELHDQFVVGVIQGGAGTSTNMNTNEVIASRANEILGKGRGGKSPVHPNNAVNMGQSSNDVIPTAIHVSASEEISKTLIPTLERLHAALVDKAHEFD
ncbi:MAG: lyase family protein, partial [Pseudolysinimonas sp.]